MNISTFTGYNDCTTSFSGQLLFPEPTVPLNSRIGIPNTGEGIGSFFVDFSHFSHRSQQGTYAMIFEETGCSVECNAIYLQIETEPNTACISPLEGTRFGQYYFTFAPLASGSGAKYVLPPTSSGVTSSNIPKFHPYTTAFEPSVSVAGAVPTSFPRTIPYASSPETLVTAVSKKSPHPSELFIFPTVTLFPR